MKRRFCFALAALAAVLSTPAPAEEHPDSAKEAALSDKFISLADGFLVSGQIAPEDIAAAKALGVTLIVNNRPDGEALGQPKGADIERAAKAAGLSYIAIPVGASGIGDRQLDDFDAALAANSGGVLAFCRTGTRSTMVWALASARASAPVEEIVRKAADAGYDLRNIAPRLQALSEAAGR